MSPPEKKIQIPYEPIGHATQRYWASNRKENFPYFVDLKWWGSGNLYGYKKWLLEEWGADLYIPHIEGVQGYFEFTCATRASVFVLHWS